jgi:hypothetical protein
MSTSTAAHDLAGIKHALELGLILGALVLAVATHGETTLTCDFKAAPEIAAMHTPGSATFLLNSYSPRCDWREDGAGFRGSVCRLMTEAFYLGVGPLGGRGLNRNEQL